MGVFLVVFGSRQERKALGMDRRTNQEDTGLGTKGGGGGNTAGVPKHGFGAIPYFFLLH